MRSSPWPKALRILVEMGQARGVRVLALSTSAAFCDVCQWQGPLRDDPDVVWKTDVPNHIDDPLHQHMERLAKQRAAEAKKR